MAVKWQPEHGKALVCVHWKDADASSPTDAFYEDEFQHDTTPMETYGLLMKQDDNGVTVMTEFYKEGSGKRVYRGRTFIPAALIVSVEVIAKPWTPRPKQKKTGTHISESGGAITQSE